MAEIDICPHSLTSATSRPPFVISANYDYGGSESWKVCGDITSRGYPNYWIGSPPSASWLKLDFGRVTDPVVRYTLMANTQPEPARMLKDWTLQGSVDNTNWDLMDTVTNQTGWSSGEIRSFTCDTTGAYRYYRLNITANNGDGTYIALAQIQLFANITAWDLSDIDKELHLDATDPATINIQTGVSEWEDKSGNARNVIQSTAGYQPAYDAVGLYGYPTVLFDGTDDRLSVQNTGLTSLLDFTVLVVCAVVNNANGGYDCFVSCSENNGIDYSQGFTIDQGSVADTVFDHISMEGAKGGTATNLHTTSKNFLFTSFFAVTSNDPSDTAFSKLFFNGAPEGTRSSNPATAINANQINIGARYYNSAFQGFNYFRLSEVMIIPYSCDKETIDKLMGHLAWKYGAYGYLPPGHPYFDNPPLNTNIPLHFNYFYTGGVRISQDRKTITVVGSWEHAEVSENQYRTTGKWYWEVKHDSGLYTNFGFTKSALTNPDQIPGLNCNGCSWQNNNSKFKTDATWTTYDVGTWAAGDVMGVLVDFDAGQVHVSKNGVLVNSGNPVMTGLAQPIWPTVTAENSTCTIRLLTSEMEYLPSGYEVWDSFVEPDNSVISSLQLLYDYIYVWIENPLNILYDYSHYVQKELNIKYVFYICNSLIIRLSNSSIISKDLLIRYIGSQDVNSSLKLRWTYALELLSQLNIKYDVYAEIMKELNIKYKVSQGEVQNFLNFVYENKSYNLAENALKMIWHSFYADSVSQTPNVSVLINNVPIPFNKVTVSNSKSRFIIIGETSTTFNTYSQIHVEDTVVVTISSDVFNLIVSDKYIRQLSNSAEEYVIEFASPGIKLLTPYSKPLNGEIGPGLSSNICIGIAASEGVTLIWSHIDKYFDSNLLYADDESKKDCIRKIVQKMGGKVLSKKDGTLVVTPKYTESISNWPNATPSRVFTNADFESISEYTSEKGNYNRVFVSSQLSSSLSQNSVIRTEEIDSHTKIVKGFATPLNSVVDTTLETSGGSWVSIDKCGLVSETIEEEIEFVSGSARTQNPIYTLLETNWLQAFLGNITFAEDGTLEAPTTGTTKGCSYVRIKYVTQYYKWIVKSYNIEAVQFILNVERK